VALELNKVEACEEMVVEKFECFSEIWGSVILKSLNPEIRGGGFREELPDQAWLVEVNGEFPQGAERE
jgi:hypothetical protein